METCHIFTVYYKSEREIDNKFKVYLILADFAGGEYNTLV